METTIRWIFAIEEFESNEDIKIIFVVIEIKVKDTSVPRISQEATIVLFKEESNLFR